MIIAGWNRIPCNVLEVIAQSYWLQYGRSLNVIRVYVQYT